MSQILMDHANNCGQNTISHQIHLLELSELTDVSLVALDMIGLKASFELHPPTGPKPVPYGRALWLLQHGAESVKSTGMLGGCCSCLKAHLPPNYDHIE